MMECPISLWLLQTHPPLLHIIFPTPCLCLAMAAPQHTIAPQVSPAPSLTLPLPAKSLKPSTSCHLVLHLSLALNLLKPKNSTGISITFHSPIPESLGMRTTRAWHQEQLLQSHLQWQEKNQQCLQKGMILMTLTTSQICNLAQEDAYLLNTAMDIPPQLCHHHPYLSPLQLHQFNVWSTLTSIVQKPQCWSIHCPASSKKMTKVPLCFHQPTLPKGWAYVKGPKGVKVEDFDNSLMYQLQSPLTCTQHKQLEGCAIAHGL